MSHIDDLFRDGLSGRKADIPNTNDLWARINAAKQQPLPEGEALDATFREKLSDRTAAVPADMWSRIAAARARRPWVKWILGATALLLLLLVAGLSFNRTGETPATPPTPAATPTTPTIAQAADGNIASSNTTGTSTITANLAAANSKTLPNTPGNNGNSAITTQGTPAATTSNIVLSVPEQEVTSVPDVNATPLTNTVVPARNLTAALAISPLGGDVAQLDIPATILPPVTVRNTGNTFRSSGLSNLKTELLFGIAYARQEFSLQDPAAAALRDIRESSEFPEFGYQITLRTTYQFNERFRLLAGLTYAEIRNELEYERFSGGQTTLITTNNNIRMLEAPVLLGYSVNGRRVNVTVNAGPLVNLSTAARGRFLDPNSGVPQDLATVGNYRNNIGLGFMASLSTAYQIGKKRPVTILVEPYFKAYPTAFTVKGAPVREKYWVAGLQLGIRKSLR